MTAGMIGLGAMGAPMAHNLAKQGLLTSVWNRTSNKAESLAAALNIQAAESPEALAKSCNIIAICVSRDQDVLEVIEILLPGLQPGAVVIDHSTVSIETAREAAEKVKTQGADFLDAPVSGGVEGARAGTLSVMVGGSRQALDKAMPALQAIGQRIEHMGDVGSGQATKVVNQILCAGINQAVTEALAFGMTLGLDMDKVIDVVSGGAAGNWFLEKRGPTMIRHRFEPGFKLALHHKDLKICQQMAEQAGIPLPLALQTLKDYQRLMDQGFGEEDISALFRLKK
ncbi:MAG TPA: NAD(P)-dependent oxidoreductase [Methylothermaceae bacterium]|nr:NAD(P)-dependent oxidoreductase [Methylothermaceae bacterium]